MANGCGIGPFMTGTSDPLYSACLLHDQFYIKNKKHGGEALRKEQDKKFLIVMLALAGDSNKLKAKAYTYYYLARGFGWIPWHFRKNNGE